MLLTSRHYTPSDLFGFALRSHLLSLGFTALTPHGPGGFTLYPPYSSLAHRDGCSSFWPTPLAWHHNLPAGVHSVGLQLAGLSYRHYPHFSRRAQASGHCLNDWQARLLWAPAVLMLVPTFVCCGRVGGLESPRFCIYWGRTCALTRVPFFGFHLPITARFYGVMPDPRLFLPFCWTWPHYALSLLSSYGH